MTTYTFTNVISIAVTGEPPLEAEVIFAFPDTYTGTEADARAYAEGVMQGDPAALATMTAERDAAIAERDAEIVKKNNIIAAYNAADADTDQAIADNT